MKKLIIVSVCAMLTAGCGVRTRVLTVERSDQEVKGNAGFVCGRVPGYVRRERPVKTRQIFEVDVSKYTEKESKSCEASE